MSKPEPLFPASADCPDCGKKTRIKWAQPRELTVGLNGLGSMKCLHCGAHHVRAVGPAEVVAETSRRFEMQYQDACGHDHGPDHEHEHEHSHGVALIPGSDKFAYIRLPN